MALPFLGFGVGLRPKHYSEILDVYPAVDWFEIISENFMVPGGRPLFVLEKIRMHYPIALHGVSLSIGSTDPLNSDYLRQLSSLVRRVSKLTLPLQRTRSRASLRWSSPIRPAWTATPIPR